MMGRVIAKAVIAPGKSRGYMRLHVRVAAIPLLRDVLGGRLPEVILSAVQLTGSESEAEISLDLGEPTRCDILGPEIARMRDLGITWDEIISRTGLGTSSAFYAWKRWTDRRAVE
jgi:hypothetical protein